MKIPGILSLAAILAGMIATPGLALATRLQQQPALALQVYFEDGPPAFMSVAPEGSESKGSWFGRFARIPSFQPPPNSLPATAVRLVPVADHGAVRIEVSVLLGEYHDKEKAVAEYLLRESQEAVVEELAGYGVKPFRLKVVATAISSDVTPPYITNKTTSIEVIELRPAQTVFPKFLVTVKNSAPKGVVALYTRTLLQKGGPLYYQPQGTEGHALIEPGQTYQFRTGGGDQGELSAAGYTAPAPTDITIATVVFDDGSFEGEAKPAADYLSIQAGYWIQLKRITAILQNAPAPSGVRELRSQISDLPDTATQKEMLSVPAKYVFSDSTIPFDSAADFKFGAHRVTQLVLDDLRRFEKSHYMGPANDRADNAASEDEMRSLIGKLNDKYSSWLSRM